MMTVLPLAKIGLVLHKPEYVEEAKRQFLIHIHYLSDRRTGLWFHGWTFEDGGHNFAGALWLVFLFSFSIFGSLNVHHLFFFPLTPPPLQGAWKLLDHHRHPRNARATRTLHPKRRIHNAPHHRPHSPSRSSGANPRRERTVAHTARSAGGGGIVCGEFGERWVCGGDVDGY